MQQQMSQVLQGRKPRQQQQQQQACQELQGHGHLPLLGSRQEG